MTTKTDEKERAEFEAWWATSGMTKFKDTAFAAWQAGRAALQSQDRADAERYRFLIAKLQQAYDEDYIETDLISLYCHMRSQFKGEREVRAEITWRDKTDELIGLNAAIDHARRVEGERK